MELPERYWEVIEILKEDTILGRYWVRWGGIGPDGGPWPDSWIERDWVKTPELEEVWREVRKQPERWAHAFSTAVRRH